MTVNEFIRKVKYEIMLSSLDIPLMVDGKSIKEVVLLRDKYYGYYFDIKTNEGHEEQAETNRQAQ